MVRMGEAQQRAGEPNTGNAPARSPPGAAHRCEGTPLRAALANNRGWHSRTGAADVDRIDALEAAWRPNPTRRHHALFHAWHAVYSSAGDAVLERRLAPGRGSRDRRRLGDAATCRVFSMLECSPRGSRNASPNASHGRTKPCARRRVGDAARLLGVDAARCNGARMCGPRTAEIHRAQQLALMQQLGLPVMRWLTTCAQVARRVPRRRPRQCRDNRKRSARTRSRRRAAQHAALLRRTARDDSLRAGPARRVRAAHPPTGGREPGDPVVSRRAGRPLCRRRTIRRGARAARRRLQSGFTRFPRDPMYLVNLTGAVRAGCCGQRTRRPRQSHAARGATVRDARAVVGPRRPHPRVDAAARGSLARTARCGAPADDVDEHSPGRSASPNGFRHRCSSR